MSLLTTIGLLAGGADALRSISGGSSKKIEALKGLEAFERQELVNPFEALKPSLEVERTALNTLTEQRAGLRDVASGQDAATAMATLSLGEERLNKMNLDFLNSMMKQEAEFDVMSAKDEAAQRAIQEQRDAQDLQSLQAQLYAGEQEMAAGMMGFAELATAAGLSQEMRLAGLGRDPYAAAFNRLNSGEGGTMDYLTTQQYGNALGSLFRRRNR